MLPGALIVLGSPSWVCWIPRMQEYFSVFQTYCDPGRGGVQPDSRHLLLTAEYPVSVFASFGCIIHGHNFVLGDCNIATSCGKAFKTGEKNWIFCGALHLSASEHLRLIPTVALFADPRLLLPSADDLPTLALEFPILTERRNQNSLTPGFTHVRHNT
jgi:hypothetical protein